MFKILKKNKNYKLIIGLFFGFLFSSSIVVYAWYNDLATDVSYDSSNNWLTATTVQGALDQLAEQKGCPIGYGCYQKKSTLALGDYVSYTPTKTSYTTNTSKTGYTSTQTINPSELNLWRVLSINGDGTVDIISEYVSSTNVYFSGQEGYKNYIGYLNVLASQYETSGVTVGSRHFGYSNQTEYITSDAYFVNPAPWTCSTGRTCTPDPDDYEAYSGGDTGYLDDYYLVNTVLGTRVANKVGGSASNYWMASREYYYNSAARYYWNARGVYSSGSNSSSNLYSYVGSGFVTSSSYNALRPIVRLKSGLSYSGVGNKDYPMEILPPDIGINPGDYISYTPSKTSYTTDTSKTGYTSTQTINPSELNLWRVLKVNIDGSVEIISEHVSSVNVYFRGQTGSKNSIGYLNLLASQYETSGITVGSRHFGYNNQTEYITSDTYYVYPAPWTCTTGGTCDPDPDNFESQAGGDMLYQKDYDLVYNVIGTRNATNLTGTVTSYWMASRVYFYNSSTYYWGVRSIKDTTGNSYNNSLRRCVSSCSDISHAESLRPIIRLKPGLLYSGTGSSDNPYTVS